LGGPQSSCCYYFRFAADGSCDRNQHPHLNDRRVCRFIIIGAITNISLAALGFAAGMVVDNAIVVIENIFTHMQQGKTRLQAAIDGTQEVAGGILAATWQTLPYSHRLVEGEAQLFAHKPAILAATCRCFHVYLNQLPADLKATLC